MPPGAQSDAMRAPAVASDAATHTERAPAPSSAASAAANADPPDGSTPNLGAVVDDADGSVPSAESSCLLEDAPLTGPGPFAYEATSLEML